MYCWVLARKNLKEGAQRADVRGVVSLRVFPFFAWSLNIPCAWSISEASASTFTAAACHLGCHQKRNLEYKASKHWGPFSNWRASLSLKLQLRLNQKRWKAQAVFIAVGSHPGAISKRRNMTIVHNVWEPKAPFMGGSVNYSKKGTISF